MEGILQLSDSIQNLPTRNETRKLEAAFHSVDLETRNLPLEKMERLYPHGYEEKKYTLRSPSKNRYSSLKVKKRNLNNMRRYDRDIPGLKEKLE